MQFTSQFLVLAASLLMVGSNAAIIARDPAPSPVAVAAPAGCTGQSYRSTDQATADADCEANCSSTCIDFENQGYYYAVCEC